MARALENDLLSAEDVARLVGVKESTVWRWCREGNLPCLKVGKHWRVRRGALEDFLRRSERPTTLVEQLRSFLEVPDNVLVITQNIDLMHRLDAAFFHVGDMQGGRLVKFYGGEQHSEEMLCAELDRNGLDVGRLEQERRFFMRAEQDPLGLGREDELRRLLDEEGAQGRTVWASFNWAKQVDLDTALEQQNKLAKLVDRRNLVVKTAALEEVIDEWSSAMLRRAQSSHAATISVSESELCLTRATPMLPS
jgi:excisionase family DNA binding protein